MLIFAIMAVSAMYAAGWWRRRATHIVATDLDMPIALHIRRRMMPPRRIEGTLVAIRNRRHGNHAPGWSWLCLRTSSGKVRRVRMDWIRQLEDLETGMVQDGPGAVVVWINQRIHGRRQWDMSSASRWPLATVRGKPRM